ncbi:MAG TPA: phosphatase PAP2 family protein [Vineibacter sp.]|nr:phosphatase PAP2 family protein [Vineibacter sp.]
MTISDIALGITAIDRTITQDINQVVGHAPIADLFIFYLADMNLLKGVLFMAVAWYFWFRGDDIVRSHVVNMLVIALLAVAVGRLLQSSLPARLRPLDDPSLGLLLPAHVSPAVLRNWSSFPSDHATLFFAMSAALAPISRRVAWAAAIWTAIIICLPRLYLGFHYASDLIGGALIGTAVAVIYLRLPSQRFSHAVVRLGKFSPGLFYAAGFVFTYELSILMGDIRQLGAQVLKLVHRLAS